MKLRTLRRALGVALLASPPLHAANFTWDGGALLGDEWSRGNNWIGNAAPPTDGTADVFFAGSVRLTPDADADWLVRSLTFNSGADNFVIGGNPLTVGPGGITNADDDIQTVLNPVVLGVAQTFDVTGTGALRLQGSVNLNGHNLTLNGGSSTVDIEGQIIGAAAVTQLGGLVRLQGAVSNTFTGAVTVNGGSLLLSAATDDAVMVPGPLTIGTGSGTATAIVSNADEQIANGSDVTVNGGAVFQITNAWETVGAVTLNGGTVAVGGSSAGGTLAVGGMTVTGGSVVPAGTAAGTLWLNGDVTTNQSPTGATISVATVDLRGGTRTFTVRDGPAPGVDLLISSQLVNGSFTKEGSGSMRLAGSLPHGMTIIRVNAGRLELQTTGGNAVAGGLIVGDGAGSAVAELLTGAQITDFGTVVVNAGGTLDLNNFGETIGALTLNGGTVTGGLGRLGLNDNVIVGGTATSTIDSKLDIGTNRTFTVNETGAADDLRVNGRVAGGSLTKTGAGTLVLSSGDNEHAGGTSVSAGTLVAAHANALGTGGLSIANGAVARAQPGLTGAVDLPALLVSPGATLDLTDNALVVRHPNLSAALDGHTAITAFTRNAFHEFAWDRSGITSTTVQADVANGVPSALGILLNNDGTGFPLFYGDGAPLPQFEGGTVDARSVLVKYTLLGDGDLNGTVDSVDFALFQAGYTGTAPYIGFAFGDYDYNGVIDTVDFGLFQAGYQYSQANPPTPEMVAFAAEHGLSLVAAVVPEPRMLGLLGTAALAALGWRRVRRA